MLDRLSHCPKYFMVEVLADGDLAAGQYIGFFYLSQTSAFIPVEESSEMIKVAGHQEIEDVVVFKETNAVFHEIVDELAQNNLLGSLEPS